MRIKRFYFLIGGYGSWIAILKKGKDLYYYSGPMAVDRLREGLAEQCSRIRPTDEQWKTFFESLRPFASTWKNEYNEEVDDGTQWEIKIVSDQLTLKASGSNSFPDDFNSFLMAVSNLTGIQLLGD